jgi:hypothetical protein
MTTSIQTPDSARQFLLSKLRDQAERDGVPLSEVELNMFLFSESVSTGFDSKMIDEFEQQYDDREYEAKVSRLLKRCYAREKRTQNGKGLWRDALTALRREDFYGLVMVDEAGIPRPVSIGLDGFGLRYSLFLAVEVVVIAFGGVLIFQPWRLHLALPDWLRLLLYPVFIGAVWLVGEAFGYLEVLQPLKRAISKQRG